MSITGYLELTSVLVEDYLQKLYNNSSRVIKKSENNSDSSINWQLVDGNKTLLTVVFTKISNSIILLNLLKVDGAIDATNIDWNDDELNPDILKLPIEPESVPQELIERFNKKLSIAINSKNLKKLFEKPLTEKYMSRESENLKSSKKEIPLPTRQDPPSRSRPNDMPDFDDEYEMKNTSVTSQPSSAFPTIGDRDLNPPEISNQPLMKPYLDPLAPDNDGGMYPSPNHPLFGSHRSGNTSRLGVPPGARYDDPLAEDDLDTLGAGLPSNTRSYNGFPGPSFGGSGNGSFPGFGGSGNSFGF